MSVKSSVQHYTVALLALRIVFHIILSVVLINYSLLFISINPVIMLDLGQQAYLSFCYK